MRPEKSSRSHPVFALVLTSAPILAFLSAFPSHAINRPSARDQSLESQSKKFYDSNLVSAPVIPGQTGDAKKKPAPTPIPPPPKQHYFNYFAEFAGPSADFALPLESYSPYGDDYVPLNLYQSIDYAYAFNNNNRLGTNISTIWNFQNEVIDKSGNIRAYSNRLTFFDPTIYYQYYNLFTNQYSWVNGKVSLDLPLSDFSRQVGYQTGLYNSYTWNFKIKDPAYYFNLNFDGWLFFYDPKEGWNRFQFAVGHEWGVHFNPTWTLHTSSVFDLAFRAQGSGAYQYSENNVDRLRVTMRCNIQPDVFQIGAFAQTPVFDMALNRVMLGLNMNWWF